MRFPDDDGRFLVGWGDRPRRQPALALFLPWDGLEPDMPYAGKERSADEDDDTGHEGIPAMCQPQKDRCIQSHQRDNRVLRSRAGNGLEIYRAIAAETARTNKNICLNFIGLYISRLQAFLQGSLWRERPPIWGASMYPRSAQLETGGQGRTSPKKVGSLPPLPPPLDRR